jgi:lipopolysaccharide biosynthesis glycosyltransferase
VKLNVVYSTDDNYAQHVGVSLTSLFETNKNEFEDFCIYIIENNLSKDNKEKLYQVCKNYRADSVFINFNQIADKLRLNIGNSISISAYARLFLSNNIDQSIEKIIYLDCDSVINGSLKELWDINMDAYYVAGVADTVAKETKLKVGMDSNDIYLNSGMLVINLKKWRNDQIEERFIDFINSKQGNVFHHDQGIINAVLHKKAFKLHPRYNAMTPFFTMKLKDIMTYYKLKDYYNQNEIKEAVKEPIFVHFTPAFVNRPWVKGCNHPLTQLYKNYLELTPWNGSPMLKDRRSIVEKFIASLYNHLPFRTAHKICRLVFT